MKRLRKLNLNIQLVAVFFTAVLLLSLGHVFLYTQLLHTMEQEEVSIGQERMENAQMKLDSLYSISETAALEILTSYTFQAWAGSTVNEQGVAELQVEASDILDDIEHVYQWFIFVKGCDQLISGNGTCEMSTYFGGINKNDTYDVSFWKSRFADAPGKHYYPAQEFRHRDLNGKHETRVLMPMSFQSYYDRDTMVVLLLDVQSICREDTYLEEGAYFFSEEGTLLYTTDVQPLVTELPQEETLKVKGQSYRVTRYDINGGPICVKLQAGSEASDILQNNFLLCIAFVIVALGVMALLVPRIIKTLLTPVDKMVDLVRQHGETQHTDLHGVSRELEQIIKAREQQAADLALSNAALSEYRLQSRMKNVYVDMQVPENQEEGDAYILYILVQYQEKCRDSFTISRAELENCLQEMMSDTLGKHFATNMLFQTEPGRFAARVALPREDGDIQAAMDAFMTRLQQEEEFACFTVVRSKCLTEGELAQAYDETRAAARLARVCGHNQLLTLPDCVETTAFSYPKSDEQKLDELVRQAKIPQAVLLAERILSQNLEAGISHAQMEILCVALVNTVAYAAAASSSGTRKVAAASVVYNTLATRCSTAEDYCQTVTGYIRSVEAVEQTEEDSDQLLSRIRQFLQENYHREFSSEEMAAQLWVSRSYLSSYFKNKTGQNLSDSIQQYRIGRAMELLRDPDVKIGDVGAMVGINSPNTFLRQFRKYTGMTPREFRAKKDE